MKQIKKITIIMILAVIMSCNLMNTCVLGATSDMKIIVKDSKTQCIESVKEYLKEINCPEKEINNIKSTDTTIRITWEDTKNHYEVSVKLQENYVGRCTATITKATSALTDYKGSSGTGTSSAGTSSTGTSSSGNASLGNASKVPTSTEHTAGEVIDEAKSFIDEGKQNEHIKQENLKKMSDTIYNILLVVGIVAAVIVGLIMGIKFILGSLEEKADIKAALIPYIIGCVVVFGAFAIWQILVDILQSL